MASKLIRRGRRGSRCRSPKPGLYPLGPELQSSRRSGSRSNIGHSYQSCVAICVPCHPIDLALVRQITPCAREQLPTVLGRETTCGSEDPQISTRRCSSTAGRQGRARLKRAFSPKGGSGRANKACTDLRSNRKRTSTSVRNPRGKGPKAEAWLTA